MGEEFRDLPRHSAARADIRSFPGSTSANNSNTSQGLTRVYHGTLLTSDCSTLNFTWGTGTQESGLRLIRQTAITAIPAGTVFDCSHELASVCRTTTFPGSSIVSSSSVVVRSGQALAVRKLAVHGRQLAAANRLFPCSELKLTFAFLTRAGLDQIGIDPDCETTAPRETAIPCTMHPVRPHRRRGIHEKRNAYQCASAGRKSHRDC